MLAFASCQPVGSFTWSREVLLPETSCAWIAVITTVLTMSRHKTATAEVVHRLVEPLQHRPDGYRA